MAKRDLEVKEQLDVEEEEKKPSFLQKLFFWFLIPVLFTIVLLLIAAQFTNTNVFEFVADIKDKVPFLASETEVVENTSLSSEKVVALQAEIQEKEAQILQLETEIETATTENEELLIEQERLLHEIEQLQRAQEQSQLEFKEILKTFEDMSAKKAAPILVEMPDADATRIMASMKPNTLTAIFEQMEPKKAAHYTQLLSQQ